MVVNAFGNITPYRCAASSPGAIVGFYPVTMFVVMTCSWLKGTPVNLCDHHGIGVNNGYLVMELLYLTLCGCGDIRSTQVLVVASVPAIVVVYGITDIFTCNGILGIAGIVSLPTCSRYPNDASKTILADFVNDRLEKIV